jgi:glucose-6-phosphate isomerase
VVDNVEPEPILELLRTLNPHKTLVNVISKSGSTAETMAAFLVFRQWLELGLGADWKKHVVVTTDPAKGILRPYAQAESLSAFEVPPSVGGRFSVTCPVGILPLAFAGVDLESLLSGARKANQTASAAFDQNLPAQTALVNDLFSRRGKNITVMMPYSTRLRFLPDWFVQLHDESLGKMVDRAGKEVRTGTTAVRAVGTTDQHAQVQLFREGPQDKLTVFVRLENAGQDLEIPAVGGLESLEYLFGKSFFNLLNAEGKATAHALAKAQQANFTLLMEKLDAYNLGWLLQHLMWQTAYLGELWNINAFDQPGVELGKEFTYALMGRKGYEKLAEELRSEGVE